jgi:DNA polymerase III subunit epsilon
MILFLDTETTALIKNSAMVLPKQPHIIEFFGLLSSDKGEEVSTLSLLIKPPIPIPVEVQHITGLKDEDVKNELEFSRRADEIVHFLEKADEVVAHNISYDMAILNFEFQRIGLTCKWPERLTCTCEQTEYLTGYRLSLSKLYELLFKETFSAHRAEGDVRAMARCYFELKKRDLI